MPEILEWIGSFAQSLKQTEKSPSAPPPSLETWPGGRERAHRNCRLDLPLSLCFADEPSLVVRGHGQSWPQREIFRKHFSPSPCLNYYYHYYYRVIFFFFMFSPLLTRKQDFYHS